MQIAPVADTHLNHLEDLPRKIIAALSAADLVIHAGDSTDLQLLKELRQLGEAKAVHGNMDSRESRGALPPKGKIEIANRRVAVTHGAGGPWGIEESIAKTFESDPLDVIIHGHSNRSQNKVINGILFFNPGKATDSLGILTIDGEIEAEVVSSRRLSYRLIAMEP